jgi:hypothetical protein
VHLTVKCGVGRMCVCVVEGGWVGGGGGEGRQAFTRCTHAKRQQQQKEQSKITSKARMGHPHDNAAEEAKTVLYRAYCLLCEKAKCPSKMEDDVHQRDIPSILFSPFFSPLT